MYELHPIKGSVDVQPAVARSPTFGPSVEWDVKFDTFGIYMQFCLNTCQVGT